MTQNLEYKLYMSGVRAHFIQLFRMFVLIITIQHFIACVYNLLQYAEVEFYEESNTWLQQQQLYNSEWYFKYIYTYYWSISTVMLIGTRGDTAIETLFTSILLLFTVTIFAYILQVISQILIDINTETQEYKRDLEIINKYMKSKNLKQETQITVRTHMQYYQDSSKEIKIYNGGKQVLDKMPSELQKSINSEINKSIVKDLKIFEQIFSQVTIDKLIKVTEDTTFIINEKILEKNDKGHQGTCLYYVLKGQVSLKFTNQLQFPLNGTINTSYKKNQSNVFENEFYIKNVEAGEIFNEESFFTGMKPTYSAISSTFTTICRIDRTQFLYLVKQNQEDYQKFCYIKDKLFFKEISKYYKKNCKICDSIYHYESECNLIFFNPSKFNIYSCLKQKNSQIQTNRQRYKRLNRVIIFFEKTFTFEQKIEINQTMVSNHWQMANYLVEINRGLSNKFQGTVKDIMETSSSGSDYENDEQSFYHSETQTTHKRDSGISISDTQKKKLNQMKTLFQQLEESIKITQRGSLSQSKSIKRRSKFNNANSFINNSPKINKKFNNKQPGLIQQQQQQGSMEDEVQEQTVQCVSSKQLQNRNSKTTLLENIEEIKNYDSQDSSLQYYDNQSFQITQMQIININREILFKLNYQFQEKMQTIKIFKELYIQQIKKKQVLTIFKSHKILNNFQVQSNPLAKIQTINILQNLMFQKNLLHIFLNLIQVPF